MTRAPGLLTLLLLSASACTTPAATTTPATEAPVQAGTKIFLDYKEPVPVRDLIKPLAQAAGKPVVLDRNTDGAKVPVVFSQPLANPEAYERIVAALENHGLRVKDEGTRVRVSRR